MARLQPLQPQHADAPRRVGRHVSFAVFAVLLTVWNGPAALSWLLPASSGKSAVAKDEARTSGPRGSRRGWLGISLSSVLASPATADEACACCELDWCGCGAKCVDCHAYLSSRGFSLPADASSAVRSRGMSDWAAAVDWQNAEAPQWRPVQRDQVAAGQSKLPGAGRGLFARERLAKRAVLPPYKGQLQNIQAVTRGGAYVWCPQTSSGGTAAAFCMDAAADDPENPARLINAAANEEQCKQVNTEICQLGNVLYFRTLQEVPAGTELVTDYGRLLT
ncbi:PRDM12 [Symbiodinium natans]|uniref:PRDM12 protein n=1 Tax=Symbiodinium natans TaxID=878477 RepID=A0A812IQV4_9DINO|nr:PRDM12 [Symbiodinium natans]